MHDPRTNAQIKRKPHQHHRPIDFWFAQDHLTLGMQPHPAQELLPPAAAACTATFAHHLPPNSRHNLAACNPSCAVWQNTTGRWHLPLADDHGNAVYQPSHAMMNFVGQNPPGSGTVPVMQMMQQSQQPMEMPMMAPYYATNQQPGYS